MKLGEIYQVVEEFVESLPGIFNGVEISFPLKSKSNPIGDWTDKNNMGMVVTGDGIGKKSGIYFFAKPDGTVFYIGKAAILHNRIWSHVNTPKTVAEGIKEFPNLRFKSEEWKEEIESVKSGKALLGVITLSSPEVAALIEVFLHTLHVQKFGKLPSLNKQIG